MTSEQRNADGGPAHFYERSYDDFLAEMYDDWYADMSDKSKGPFRPVVALMDTFEEIASQEPSSIRILDLACGTGNLFTAFTEDQYEVWASDGSREMLRKATKNAEKLRESARPKLITDPIRWTDRSALHALRQRAGLFDVVLIFGNSFCHIPATAEYMRAALESCVDLLKPGGRLLIDTKRYIETAPMNGVPIFRELRFVEASNEWVRRLEREEMRKIQGREVFFHTRLHYDVDPSFSRKMCRAHIVITRYGKEETPRTMVLTYYPLPAEVLESHMKKLNFHTSVIPARTSPTNWNYDIVIGQKPLE
jgi:SAM-dependent methyltransferase